MATCVATPCCGRSWPHIAASGYPAHSILGQQISVAGATMLSGRLVERFGAVLAGGRPGIDHLFPTAERLAEVSLPEMRAVGLPEARARTILGLAEAAASGALDLSAAASDPELALIELQKLSGIGPWTAHYVAMRALHWPDAFPADDLAIRRALRVTTSRQAEARAKRWQPWRGYAAMHLWSSAGSMGSAA
jgi:AraC family transcriptional regulator of adaptative response / DNA-3-methyladenine glycosylase II